VLRLTPRKSFETWVEVVRGYSDPWTIAEIDAARSIRLLIGIKRADDASQFKSQFLANMSHEIRTPMTAILGYADILIQEMEDLSPVDRRAMVETIKSSGAHLLSLIDDILDLSKIDADKLEVSRSQCSLAAIVRDTISLMRVPAQSKGLTLSVEFEGPIPESIHTDSRRLRQVLLNLLGNAVKFTEAGQVRMVVRLDQSEPTLPMVVIDVIDSGVGLTEEQLTRVFEPFIQADSSTSRRFGGTGLGLAISKSLAEKLGGSLAAESRYGQGSTFRLRIDAGSLAGVRMLQGLTETSIGREPPAQTTKPPATGRLTGRVLVAEDHEVNQLLISRHLTSAGAQVVVVTNGKDAVETAMKHEAEGRPFVVILMDMQMPLMDGLEATAQLRSRGYSRPIIALTAGAMQGDREQCLQAGCDDYLTKPIKQQQLIALVAAMEERQAREPGEVSS
jgi:CheY-like chemotaxis protein/nitrogen-specific signal transduction histidine kinase